MVEMSFASTRITLVSELPWDPKTGTLQRDLAEGVMNPTCRSALEAALRIREAEGNRATAITMGPPMAEEVLREAIALGADRGILLTDRPVAGGDTLATSYTLARAMRRPPPGLRPRLVPASPPATVRPPRCGPQLAEELSIPGAACCVDEIARHRPFFRCSASRMVTSKTWRCPCRD